MGLSTPGIGSGLDIKTMVDAMVKAEITPMQIRHDTQLNKVSTELSAIGQLKNLLSTFQTSLNSLSDLSQLFNTKYSVSDPSFFTTTLTPQAPKGTYQIEVQQLAQNQTLASNYFASPTTTVGNGTLTINFGTYSNNNTTFTPNPNTTSINITIAPGNDSLTAVCNAINNSNSGVTANIIQDNQGARLTITSSQSGSNYAMQVGGITNLGYDPTTGSNTLTQTIAAQDSVVKINGLSLTQSSNKLQNALSGVTLNLSKAQPGNVISLTIDDNKDQVTNLLNDFVKKYNDSMTLLNTLTGYNSATGQSGLFQGDPQLRTLQTYLNRLATSPIANTKSTIRTLADIGIATNNKGLLEIDQNQLKQALTNHYNDIGTLFSKTATATDPNISIKSVGAHVPAGQYNVVLNQYTPGVNLSGSIGNLPATSSDGMTLNGSGTLGDLTLNVLSGTTGSRGHIQVHDGIAVVLNHFLDSYLNDTGDLTERTNQLDNHVAQLGQMQDQINTRSANLQTRYLNQFTALDVLLSQMQSTSSFLTQQLSSLPTFKTK